jgi:hypothetical protein
LEGLNTTNHCFAGDNGARNRRSRCNEWDQDIINHASASDVIEDEHTHRTQARLEDLLSRTLGLLLRLQ